MFEAFKASPMTTTSRIEQVYLFLFTRSMFIYSSIDILSIMFPNVPFFVSRPPTCIVAEYTPLDYLPPPLQDVFVSLHTIFELKIN